MRIILASLALTLPAAAQDSAWWETTGCQLVPVHGEAWVAEVICRNELTSMTSPDVSAALAIDGLTVQLAVAQTLGRTPDSFMVTPPDGFVAEPSVLVLDEGTVGVVVIREYLGI